MNIQINQLECTKLTISLESMADLLKEEVNAFLDESKEKIQKLVSEGLKIPELPYVTLEDSDVKVMDGYMVVETNFKTHTMSQKIANFVVEEIVKISNKGL